jgi:Transglycosylase SLT domain
MQHARALRNLRASTPAAALNLWRNANDVQRGARAPRPPGPAPRRTHSLHLRMGPAPIVTHVRTAWLGELHESLPSRATWSAPRIERQRRLCARPVLSAALFETQVPRSHRPRWFTWCLCLLAGFALVGCVALFWPSHELDALIQEVAQQEQVDAATVEAIVWHESRFVATKHRDGGYGLMQIGPGTGIEWAATHGVESFMVTDLFDARTNLQAGSWYLSRALQRWEATDDPTVFALADYAAGPDAVRAWVADSKKSATLISAIRGTPTGDFVRRVLERARSR